MSKPLVLLIEDDAWLAESYERVLKDLYSVTIVATGVAAMDSVDAKAYDLIIADVMLENGLVIDLFHELQTHSDTMNIPVIVCTSLAASISVDDLKTYGVVAVLNKSTLTPEGLRVAVQRAFGTRVV